MGYRLTFELLLSESAYQTCKDCNIDIITFMTEALFTHIQSQRDIKDNLTKVSLIAQYEEMKRTMEGLEKLLEKERSLVELESRKALKIQNSGLKSLLRNITGEKKND